MFYYVCDFFDFFSLSLSLSLTNVPNETVTCVKLLYTNPQKKEEKKDDEIYFCFALLKSVIGQSPKKKKMVED